MAFLHYTFALHATRGSGARSVHCPTLGGNGRVGSFSIVPQITTTNVSCLGDSRDHRHWPRPMRGRQGGGQGDPWEGPTMDKEGDWGVHMPSSGLHAQ